MRRRGGQRLEFDMLKRACGTFVRLFEDGEVKTGVNGTPLWDQVKIHEYLKNEKINIS